jgi:hypothetical protein
MDTLGGLHFARKSILFGRFWEPRILARFLLLNRVKEFLQLNDNKRKTLTLYMDFFSIFSQDIVFMIKPCFPEEAQLLRGR